MSDIIPVNPTATFVPELKAKTTEHLKQLLAEQLSLTVQSLVKLAWIVRILEERGEDLSDLRVGLLNYLRLIAYGQVLPEVVVRFAANPMVIQKISALPEPDQRRLAAGEPVRLIVLGPDGQGFTHRMLDPLRLSRDQVAQVFGKAHLRPDSEQIAMLEDRRSKPVATARDPARGKARADRQRGGLVVNRTFVPHAAVVSALADLKSEGEGDTPGMDERENIVVPLTPEEHRRLRITAAQGSTTMTDLVRNALRSAGLI